jgi:hypothetical protein
MWYASDFAETEVKLYVFCNVALDENDWSASFFDFLSARERALGTLYIFGWVGLTWSLNIVLYHIKSKVVPVYSVKALRELEV